MNFVERNSERGFGQPVIIGRRLTVYSLMSLAYFQEDMDNFLYEFGLSKQELKSAILYCKEQRCKLVNSLSDHYCVGCVLRNINEEEKSNKGDFIESDGISISKDNATVYLGTLDELGNDELGIEGWVLAEAVDKKWSL